MRQELLWGRRTSDVPTLPDIVGEKTGSAGATGENTGDPTGVGAGDLDTRWTVVAASVNATISKELLHEVLRGRAHLGLLAVLNDGYSGSHDSLGAPFSNQEQDHSDDTQQKSSAHTQQTLSDENEQELGKARQELAGQLGGLAQGTSPNARSINDISKTHMVWSRCFLSTAASGPCMSPLFLSLIYRLFDFHNARFPPQ